MAARIASSELSRKGVRYRATENGQFTLTASVRIPAGRSIAANEFLDVAVLAPGVNLVEAVLTPSSSLEDSGNALTCRLRAYDYTTAVASNHATGLDTVNLVMADNTTWRSTAIVPIRLTNTGADAATTFIWTATQPTSWDPVTGAVTTNFNVTIPGPSPRAFPLTQARIPAATGTKLIRVTFPAAPSVQTAAAATNRVITVHLTCVAASVNVAQQPTYNYADRRGTDLISVT